MRLVALSVAIALAPVGAAEDGRGQEAGLVAPPSYYRPAIVNGRTFPVARASWLSVIELAEDWHEPRMRRVGGRWRQVGVHEGNDITAEKGTPILSVTAGTIERTGWTFYSGDRVGVRGTDGSYYFYAHVSGFAGGIVPGKRVDAGTVLGWVGNTGYGPPGHEDEFPPHLHLGIQRSDGRWVNPYPLMSRLYSRAARASARGERRLAELARAGDRVGFERLAERLYLGAQDLG